MGIRPDAGRLTVRCKLHVEEKNGRTSIVIDELPYTVLRKSILETIKGKIAEGKITDIAGGQRRIRTVAQVSDRHRPQA
ncbi:MAG: hypothetical protein KatS3mg104_2560 [Phycisphaerae bacterium]|nr:MAG: hypothetical protein KatS3mg104_2560 [Phycisphaerae bacterium]